MKPNNVLSSDTTAKPPSRLSFGITVGMSLVLLAITAGLLVDDHKPVLRTLLLMAAGAGMVVMSFALYSRK